MRIQANKGSQDLTQGSVYKGLISFAIPLLLGNLFQQLYNTADAWVVGNFLDKTDLAAVTSSGNLIFMLVGLINGIAMGAGVVIAKFFGARDEKSLERAIHTDLAFGLAAGIFLTAFGMIMTPQILRWMGTPATVLPKSISYFRVYFAGVLAMVMYNNCTGILQALGDSRHPLYYLMVSSAINIILDLVFVAGFGWGVGSAALATSIAQAISACLALRRLVKFTTVCPIRLKKIRFDVPMLKQIVRFGLPAGIQNSVIGLANVVVQSKINRFQEDAMAGCGSYAKVEGYAFLPVTCFAMGLATFVGQNLGAKQYDRVKKGTRFGFACSMGLSMVMSVLIYSFAPNLIALFNDDPAVVAYGTQQAHLEAWFFCFLALSHCMAGVFRGAGKASVPMAVMLVCWCLIRVTYITLMLNYVWFDIRVIFSAYPLTWSLSAIVFTIYYFKADWMHHFDRLEQRKAI